MVRTDEGLKPLIDTCIQEDKALSLWVAQLIIVGDMLAATSSIHCNRKERVDK